jgi:CRISPR-associated protein (TIGR02584 family)
LASLPNNQASLTGCILSFVQPKQITKSTPHEPRRILVCVTGLSPQIVTETLYALCVAKGTPWVPHEIRLITTQRGAENAQLMLLSNNPGWFHRLLKDWSLPPIAFDVSHIEVLRDHEGKLLNDIRDDRDNQQAADGIANLIRQLTQDDNTEIHASIAGGRKTMGFFMGYAMSLWGRAQDKLSHVLVSAPFEGRSEFFYPTPEPQVIAARDRGQDPLDASKAEVWLGDIPFVRLRSLLPASIRSKSTGFASAVAAANRALDQIELIIDVPRGRILINDTPMRLPPLQLALMSLLAWRCIKGMPALRAPNKEVNDPDWKNEALQVLKQALGSMHIPGSVYERLQNDKPFGDSFTQQLSKLEKSLRDSGNLPLCDLIDRSEDHPRSRQRSYSLALKAEHVHFRSS